MPDIRPFRALRYDPASIADLSLVLAPPYDVIDAGRARAAARPPSGQRRPTRPADAMSSRDEPDDRYRRAARVLAAWRSDGTLHKDPHPSIYVYEQTYRVPGTDVDADPAWVLRPAPAGAVRTGFGRPAPRADHVRPARGPLQAPARDRRQHQPGGRAVRRSRRRRPARPRRGHPARRRPRRDRRRRRPAIACGRSPPTATRRARLPRCWPPRRAVRSPSPTATIATRRRCATATSAG